MSNELVRITPEACSHITLDNFVSRAKPFEGVVFDFLGDSPETAHYVRTRISDIYRSRKDLFGYLEISRTGEGGSPSEWYHMLGVIEVPGSIVDTMRERDSELLRRFAHDFKVDINSPDNAQIAPFFGFELPEDTYYWCAHPKAHNVPRDKAEFFERYGEDMLILTGYLSKMDQWIEHAMAGMMGKERLQYDGIARQVGARRYNLLSAPTNETPLIE